MNVSGKMERGIHRLLAIAVAIPLLGFTVAAWYSHEDVANQAIQRADHINRLLEEHTVKAIESITVALRLTKQSVANIEDEQIATSKLLWDSIVNLQQSIEQADSLFVLDKDGKILMTSREFSTPPISLADRDYFSEQQRSDNGVFIGQPYVGRISNRIIFNLSIRRTDTDGAFNGVIGSSPYIEYFEKFYQNAGDGRDNPSIELFRSDGVRLVGHPVQDIASGISHVDFSTSGKSDRTGTFLRQINGTDRLFRFRRISTLPLIVAYGIDTRTIFHDWLERLLLWGFISILVGACLSAFCFLTQHRVRHEAEALAKEQETSARLRQEIEGRHQAESALRHAQKLDVMGQITGGIAHDFNNLLMIIMGSLTLADRRPEPDSVRKQLTHIRYAAERGAKLTRHLLAFARRQELKPETVDIRDLLKTYGPFLEQALGGSIKLIVNIERDIWPVHLDSAEFEVALLNLTINARDAMAQGGTVSIDATNITLREALPNVPIGTYVCVRVNDTGFGIEPDTLARIFEPFFTTKDVGRGTGLGMSQVHGFMKQSDGAIEIESRVGEGTTVSLYLPRYFAVARSDQTEESKVSTVRRAAHILLVEDNQEVAVIIASLLKEAGLTSTAATTGAEALSLLQGELCFDLMITDVIMPGGMNGVELAKTVRQKRPTFPIILMTGYEGKVPVSDLEPFITLRKPVTLNDLIEAINQVFEAPFPVAA